MINYKEKLNHISAFVFDVDGVLTDASLILFKQDFVRTMNTKDGFALQYAVKKGYPIGIITGGRDEAVKFRLNALGITDIYMNTFHKMPDFEDFLYKYSLKPQEVLYMGDDIPDYEAMTIAGVSAAPKDACPEILDIADYVSPMRGGKGCVRDVIEQTLKAKGDWNFLEEQENLPKSH